jgi:hypothetical protein
VIAADTDGGWRYHTKTACFYEHAVVDSLDDRLVLATLSIFPRPKIQDHDFLPRFTDGVWRDSRAFVCSDRPHVVVTEAPPVAFAVVGGQVVLFIDLIGPDDGFNPSFKWKQTKSGKIYSQAQVRQIPASWVREPPPEKGIAAPSSWVDIQLQLRPEPRPFVHPISFEWCKRFFPGGLPSLGKRK